MSNISFGGIGMGRGRGYGRGIIGAATSKPSEPSTNNSNGFASSSNANNSDDIWDDSGATNTNDGWGAKESKSSNADSWGGGNSSSNNTWSGANSNRSQGGGGGGRSNTCFKCNKEGHMSRECPEGGSSNNACFNCGQEGHRSNECSEPRKPRGGGGACFNCKEEGHRSNECPQPKKSQACFNCGQEGHRSSDCTEPRKPRGGENYKHGFKSHINKSNSRSSIKGTRACFKCNEEGHMSRDCTNQDARPAKSKWLKKKRACRKCGEEGHMSRECPEGGGESTMKCYKCQGEGHMSRECPNAESSSNACFRCKEEGHQAKDCTNPDTREGADGKPRSTYVPDEVTDENEIFNVNPIGINFSRYQAIPVKASGDNCPKHISSFQDANFRPLLVKNIERSKYTTPTPVQKYTIPILLNKRDLMACAQTGSGKTAAFLLPIINSMFEATDLPGAGTLEPWAVIIAPTRELAIQIYNEAVKFSYGSIVKPAIAYGGTSVSSQAIRLTKGCHILVATPGRLLQFLNDGKISFRQVHYLVLDEADRLLDMGFKSDIEKMVHHNSMPPKEQRQTLMFSATFAREVQELAGQFLASNYIFLEVGIVGAANADVKQYIFQIGQFEKRQKLLDLLSEYGSDKTLVFVEQKKNTDFIASFLSQNDIMTTSIHGDREQREREEALRDFRSGKMKVLVATAVAARGLDITGVRHVINFDLTKDIDEYVHRIGRTGRVGNTGRASSFFDVKKDGHLAADLLRIFSDAGQEVPSWLEEAARGGGYGGNGGNRFNNRDIRQNQNVTSSSFGGAEDDWGSSKPATNASVAVEEESWD